MSCERVRAELVGFHFATLEEPTRERVESHLLACGACLREYLALKRAVETGEHEPAPSPAVHARLRRAVAKELGVPTAPRRGWAWWERPLAVAVAAAAVMAAMGATRAVASAPGSPPHAQVRGELRASPR